MTHANDLIRDLARAADGCERSWSITGSEIEERALFFFDMSVKAARMIAKTAVSLDLDEQLLADWSSALPAADAIGIALRRDRTSVRLYTQYWTLIATRVGNGDHSPYPLYRGFKSLPDRSVRRDDYVCLPMAPREVFWPPMKAALTGLGADGDAAEAAFAPLDADSAIFTATQNPERRSWLTTVRRAELDPAAVADLLAPLTRREGGQAIVDAANAGQMLHMAGGSDTVKGGFATLYFSSTPEAVLDRLL